MKTYEEMHDEFEKKVKELQETCNHEDVTAWIEEQWAPAHPTGYMVKVCNICNKVVKRGKCSEEEEKDWVVYTSE